MNAQITVTFLLALLFSIAMEAQTDPGQLPDAEARPAAGTQLAVKTESGAGDPCPTMHELWSEAMEAEADAPTGESVGGLTLTDVFRRLIAGVEGVGLEEGDTSTVLTWNLNQQVAALLELVNEPQLYDPIKAAIQDDALSQRLSDRVGPADDLTFTLRYVHKDSSDGRGTQMTGRAAVFENYHSFGTFAKSYLGEDEKYMESVSLRDPNTGQCMSETELRQVREELSELTAAMMNVNEWEARVYYRQRDRLVGPSQFGFNAKYTWALDTDRDKNEEADVHQVTKDWFFAPSRRLASIAKSSGEGADQAAERDVSSSGRTPDPERTLRRLIKQQRFSLQVSFDESEDYRFTSSIPSPITLERSRALVGTAAYSLEFPVDGSDAARLPRYEVQLSYENVDGDPARQNRFVARAIVSKGLTFLGETTDLTFGLVYANKPEFLVNEDIDEQLSARLGLSFKVGRAGGR